MIHFLRVVWGIILFVGLTLLNTLLPLEGLAQCVVVAILELVMIVMVSAVVGTVLVLNDRADDVNPLIIFDLPKLLYFIGKPVVVEKDGGYGVRRGFIVHQYRGWYEWQEEPNYASWPVIDSILKEMYAPKEKIKKTKERVLNQYDLYVLENSHTKEYLEAMKEVQECLK